MRVEFEYTPEELVDAAERFMARSRAITSIRRKELIYSSLISGALAFLVLFSKGWIPALIAGILGALIGAALFTPMQRRTVAKRLRKLIQEKLKPGEPLVCEVELTAEGVGIRQAKSRTIYEWAEVETVNHADDSVEVFTRYGAGVIVRNRAFKSVDEKKQFVNLANSYLGRPTISD
jgi:hypothetical protein